MNQDNTTRQHLYETITKTAEVKTSLETRQRLEATTFNEELENLEQTLNTLENIYMATEGETSETNPVVQNRKLYAKRHFNIPKGFLERNNLLQELEHKDAVTMRIEDVSFTVTVYRSDTGWSSRVPQAVANALSLEVGDRVDMEFLETHTNQKNKSIEQKVNDQMTDSEKQMLEDLKRVAQETGNEAITVSEYNERGDYSHNSFHNVFGSWNDAKEMAGLETNSRGGNR